MKKIFTFFLMLSAAVLSMQAVEYNIWVCGTQVTDDNAADVLNTQSSGKYISYDPYANTLCFYGCPQDVIDYSDADNAAIKIGESGAQLMFVMSDAAINNPKGNALELVEGVKGVVLAGRTPKVTFKGKVGLAMAEGSELTIKNYYDNAVKFTYPGIDGVSYQMGSNTTVNILSSTVYFDGKGSMADDTPVFNYSADMARYDISIPSQLNFVPKWNYTYNTKYVPMGMYINYELLVSGVFPDFENNKIVFKDVNWLDQEPESVDGPAKFMLGSDSTVVEFQGNNTIEALSTIFETAPGCKLLLTGSNVVLDSKNHPAIYASDNLYFDNLKHGEFISQKEEAIKMENSSLLFDVKECPYIIFKAGSGKKVFSYPINFQMDSKLKWLSGNSGTQTAELGAEQYGIITAYGSINSLNCDDLLGDGSISYDPSTKTLTLVNAVIETLEDGISGLYCNVDNLTIKVVGQCSIKSTESVAFMTNGSVRFEGDGQLSIVSQGNAFITSAPIQITNIALSVEGAKSGFMLDKVSPSTYDFIALENCTLHVGASENGPYLGFVNAFRARSCSCVEQDITYNKTNLRYEDADSQPYTGELNFEPTYDLAIDNQKLFKKDGSLIDVYKDGTVIFDAHKNMLTLENAHLECTAIDAISTNMDNFVLKLVGKNTITWASDVVKKPRSGLFFGGENSYILGGGSLSIVVTGDNPDRTGIFANGNLTIERSGLVVDALCGISANGSTGMYLTLLQASLEVVDEANVVTPIVDFANITLEGTELIEPASLTYNTSKGKYYDGSKAYLGAIKFAPKEDAMYKYGVYVKGVQVTTQNCEDVLEDGTVSYNPATRTLTFTNAEISHDKVVLRSYVKNLIVVLNGENVFVRDHADELAIEVYGHTTFEGEGTLDVKGKFMVQEGLYVHFCQVTVEGDGRALYTYSGPSYPENDLIVKDAMLSVKNTLEMSLLPAIESFNEIILDQCSVTTPEEAVISDGTILNDKKEKAKEVIIEPASVRFTLKVNESDWGKIRGPKSAYVGRQVSFKAVAEEDCEFARWEYDGKTSTKATLTIAAVKNMTIKAVFTKDGSEGLEEVVATLRVKKILRNGQLLIETENGVFDVNGRKL